MKQRKPIQKQRIVSLGIAAATAFATLSLGGCGAPELLSYEKADYMTYGFWAPATISEESYQLYKDCGMNTLLMVDHHGPIDTDNRYYLGSRRTLKALQTCKAVGLNAILGDATGWYAEYCESLLDNDYASDAPFTTYYYEEYADIIKGVHVSDEPKKTHMPDVFREYFVEDFKKAYPDAYYYVNLFGGPGATQYDTYQEYLDDYCNYVTKSGLQKPWLSIDFYPYRATGETVVDWLQNYDQIAKTVKRENMEFGCYLQSGTGGELRYTMRQGEMLQQMNVALSYGVHNFGYYCYDTPIGLPLGYGPTGGHRYTDEETGIDYMYSQTILKHDDTPSEIYYYVQAANKWLADIADVLYSYNWQASFAVHGETDYGGALDFISDKVPDGGKIRKVTATENALVGCFAGDKGEAYMVTNFVDPQYETSLTFTAKFNKTEYIAVYARGQEPRVVKLNKGTYTADLDAGEATILIPLA